MKLLLGTLASLLLLLACGGGARKTADPELKPEAPSACAKVAERLADLFVTSDDHDSFDEEKRAPLTRMVNERCQADGWSAEALACFDDGPDIDVCEKLLTEEQRNAVDEQFDREFSTEDRQMEAPTKGAPPPDDPCGGGA